MSATGIGAPVRRLEDQRYITGKGHYVDDVNRHGQAYAYFLRSPHAHARIASIDSASAAAEPGVIAIFTGDDLAADKVGGLICGWMIHSKDGSPMKAGPHPALAQGKVRYVGDHVAVVIADTYAEAKDAAEKIVVDYEVLAAVAETARARTAGGEAVHEVAPDNTVFEFHLGNKDETEAAFARAAHVTKLDIVNNRLIPNAMEPRAAVGDWDSGTDSFTLYTTSQNPHVARLVLSAFIGIAPEHKLRVIAPDVGGGFGSKIFIYAEGDGLRLGRQEGRSPGEMDGGADGGFPVGRARPRSRDPCRTRDGCVGQDDGVEGPHGGQSRSLSVDLFVFRADLPLRAVAVGAVRHSGHLRRSRRGLHQHGPGGRLSRCRPARGYLRDRAYRRSGGARVEEGPGRIPAAELHHELPASDARHHVLRHGRLRGLARQGLGRRGLQGFPG